MFRGSIVWKGIVYSILMALAKMLVSGVVYAEHFPLTTSIFKRQTKKTLSPSNHEQMRANTQQSPSTSQTATEQPHADPPHCTALLVGLAMVARGEIGFLIASLSQSSGTLMLKERNESDPEASGEDVFLVIVWSVVLCTIIGPLGVGIIVRKLKASS